MSLIERKPIRFCARHEEEMVDPGERDCLGAEMSPCEGEEVEYVPASNYRGPWSSFGGPWKRCTGRTRRLTPSMGTRPRRGRIGSGGLRHRPGAVGHDYHQA
jgi:hypothetical protein